MTAICFLPCCDCYFGGIQPLGGVAFWCLVLLRIGFSAAAARSDVFLPLFIHQRRILRLCGAMCGCVGRDRSKTTGGSACVLRRAAVLFCIPLFVLCVNVARCVLTRDE
ncbi:hypothetical protein BCY84_10558 [Trypanosoma cruzi cruzi]|nr:hypothetical protein BCY84_10558 [Trypanosoma cruzi cruzi]